MSFKNGIQLTISRVTVLALMCMATLLVGCGEEMPSTPAGGESAETESGGSDTSSEPAGGSDSSASEASGSGAK